VNAAGAATTWSDLALPATEPLDLADLFRAEAA
jgi:hypothetical protein